MLLHSHAFHSRLGADLQTTHASPTCKRQVGNRGTSLPQQPRSIQCHSSWTEDQLSWEDKMALEKLEAQKREEQAIEARKAREWERERARQQGLAKSSWTAKEKGGGRGGGADYLYELGKKSNQNTNVDAGQNIDMIDSLFAGGYLGSQSDIANGSLRNEEFRSFNHFVGDYYIAPAFLEKVALHIAKNYLVDLGMIDLKVRVPLILGIWGEKGMGKTFQTELALKKLGAEAVVMSAGELEHEWAGTPGKLIRERYKKAGELSANRGKISVLMINDIDAGLGHFADTQVTVNNQMVIGTLMNLCDHPNSVSVGGDWQEGSRVRRTPIIVTGNDFTKMFAPLIRDGRFEKFMWKPSMDDLVNIVHSMYQDDGLCMDDVYNLIKRFPKQPLDFYGALRSSQYDDQIRKWIEKEVLGGQRLTHENSNMAALTQRLVKKDGLPDFEPMQLTLQDVIQEGERLENEQELVMQNKLSKEYMKDTGAPKIRMVGFGG